jgi:hypothetical protein
MVHPAEMLLCQPVQIHHILKPQPLHVPPELYHIHLLTQFCIFFELPLLRKRQIELHVQLPQMYIFIMNLRQLHGQNLHKLLCKLIHQNNFLVMIQILSHFLLKESLEIHKNRIIEFFDHQSILSILPARQ